MATVLFNKMAGTTRARFLTLGMVPTLDTPEELCRDRQEPASKDSAWQESST
jgi:hypothetical protein